MYSKIKLLSMDRPISIYLYMKHVGSSVLVCTYFQMNTGSTDPFEDLVTARNYLHDESERSPSSHQALVS